MTPGLPPEDAPLPLNEHAPRLVDDLPFADWDEDGYDPEYDEPHCLACDVSIGPGEFCLYSGACRGCYTGELEYLRLVDWRHALAGRRGRIGHRRVSLPVRRAVAPLADDDELSF
jgi:hypothetical protein